MGTVGLLVVIVVAVLFFRVQLILLAVGLFLAGIAYGYIMSQVASSRRAAFLGSSSPWRRPGQQVLRRKGARSRNR